MNPNRFSLLALLSLAIGCQGSGSRETEEPQPVDHGVRERGVVQERGVSGPIGVHFQFEALFCKSETGEGKAKIPGVFDPSDEVFLVYTILHSGPDGSPKGGVISDRMPGTGVWGDKDAGEWVFKKPHHVWEGYLKDGEFVVISVSVLEKDKGPGPGPLAKSMSGFARSCGEIEKDILNPVALAANPGLTYGAYSVMSGFKEGLKLLENVLGDIEWAMGGGNNDYIGDFQIIAWNQGGVLRKELRVLQFARITTISRFQTPMIPYKFADPKYTPHIVLDGNGGSPQQYYMAVALTKPNSSGKWKRVSWKKDSKYHAH